MPWQIPIINVPGFESFILRFIQTYDNVTLAELAEALGELGQGDQMLTAPQDGNLILWTGMSQSLAAAMKKLIESKRVKIEPTVGLTYLLDSIEQYLICQWRRGLLLMDARGLIACLWFWILQGDEHQGSYSSSSASGDVMNSRNRTAIGSTW